MGSSRRFARVFNLLLVMASWLPIGEGEKHVVNRMGYGQGSNLVFRTILWDSTLYV